MKPRRVVIQIEAETDLSITELRETPFDLLLDDLNPTAILEVLEVRVNVMQAKAKPRRRVKRSSE
jgi:hypothetical protein